MTQQHRVAGFIEGIIFQSGAFVPFIQIVQQNVLQPGTQLPIAEQSQQPFASVVIGQLAANGSEGQNPKAHRLFFRQGQLVRNRASPPEARITRPAATWVKFGRQEREKTLMPQGFFPFSVPSQKIGLKISKNRTWFFSKYVLLLCLQSQIIIINLIQPGRSFPHVLQTNRFSK